MDRMDQRQYKKHTPARWELLHLWLPPPNYWKMILKKLWIHMYYCKCMILCMSHCHVLYNLLEIKLLPLPLHTKNDNLKDPYNYLLILNSSTSSWLLTVKITLMMSANLVQILFIQGSGECVSNDCKFDSVEIHRSLTPQKCTNEILRLHVEPHIDNHVLANRTVFIQRGAMPNTTRTSLDFLTQLLPMIPCWLWCAHFKTWKNHWREINAENAVITKLLLHKS